MPMFGADNLNVLFGFAYLGGMTKEHIQRLWGIADRTTDRLLARLQGKEGRGVGQDKPLIEAYPWYSSGPVGTMRRKAFVYHLTDAGHAYIKKQDQYPRKPPTFRKRLTEHDMRTVDAIVRLIELARPADLSGINVEMEVRLDPTRARPRVDALVIMQLGGGFNRQDLVPWSTDRAIADETRHRFAIESDNNTEPRAVIRGKAEAYATLHHDREWRQAWTSQYGPLPAVLWVVPHAQRLDLVCHEWNTGFPNGGWMVTTDQGLEQNTWSGPHRERPGELTTYRLRFQRPVVQRKPVVLPPNMLTPHEQQVQKQQIRIAAEQAQREELERQEREVREREELALRQQQLEEKLKAQRAREAQEQQARYEQEQRAQQRRAAEEERLRLARQAEEARQEQERQVKAQAEARRRRNEALLKWGTLPLWGPFVALAWVAQGLVGMHGTDENLAARFIAAGGVFAVLYFGLLTPLFRVIDETFTPPATPAAQDCGRWVQEEPIPLRYGPSLASAPVISRMTGDEVLTSLCTTQLVDEVVDGHQHSITWLHVRLTPNIEGWVNQEFLEPAEE